MTAAILDGCVLCNGIIISGFCWFWATLDCSPLWAALPGIIFVCVRHKHKVDYTTGEVLCVPLQVPCPFPSHCSEPHGDEGVVWEKAQAALNLKVMLWVSLPYMLLGAVTCLPSRVRPCPGRAMMLLQHCSPTPPVSAGITITSVRYTLKTEMDFFMVPRKFIVLLKLFYQTSFFTER